MFISLKNILKRQNTALTIFLLLGTRLTQIVGRDQFRISYIIIFQCGGCPFIKANIDKIMHFCYAF